jgi:hypothetical protein
VHKLNDREVTFDTYQRAHLCVVLGFFPAFRLLMFISGFCGTTDLSFSDFIGHLNHPLCTFVPGPSVRELFISTYTDEGYLTPLYLSGPARKLSARVAPPAWRSSAASSRHACHSVSVTKGGALFNLSALLYARNNSTFRILNFFNLQYTFDNLHLAKIEEVSN